MLPTLLLDGILHLDVINDFWKVVTFYYYINILLDNINSFPLHNPVVVMDNASIHYSLEIRELIEAQ